MNVVIYNHGYMIVNQHTYEYYDFSGRLLVITRGEPPAVVRKLQSIIELPDITEEELYVWKRVIISNTRPRPKYYGRVESGAPGLKAHKDVELTVFPSLLLATQDGWDYLLTYEGALLAAARAGRVRVQARPIAGPFRLEPTEWDTIKMILSANAAFKARKAKKAPDRGVKVRFRKRV